MAAYAYRFKHFTRWIALWISEDLAAAGGHGASMRRIDRVVSFRDVPQRHTYRSEFDVDGLTDLPNVEIVMADQRRLSGGGHSINRDERSE